MSKYSNHRASQVLRALSSLNKLNKIHIVVSEPPSTNNRTSFLTKIKGSNTLKWASAIVALIGALVLALANIETILTKYEEWDARYNYMEGLHRPFNYKLQDSDINGWSSGRIDLALMQIDAYLGRLPTDQPWLKRCMQNIVAFPNDSGTQLNDRYRLEESSVDRHNRRLLRVAQDKIYISRIEEDKLNSISDSFERARERASMQLLALRGVRDLGGLSTAELFLLRNAIYARHGRKFENNSLARYFQRTGWYKMDTSYKFSRQSPVEICNTFYLFDRYGGSEIGKAGRGIVIHVEGQVENPLQEIQSSACACLRKKLPRVTCYTTKAQNEYLVNMPRSDIGVILKKQHLPGLYLKSILLNTDQENIPRDYLVQLFVSLANGIEKTLSSKATPNAIQRSYSYAANNEITLAMTSSMIDRLSKSATLINDVSDMLCTSLADAF